MPTASWSVFVEHQTSNPELLASKKKKKIRKEGMKKALTTVDNLQDNIRVADTPLNQLETDISSTPKPATPRRRRSVLKVESVEDPKQRLTNASKSGNQAKTSGGLKGTRLSVISSRLRPGLFRSPYV